MNKQFFKKKTAPLPQTPEKTEKIGPEPNSDKKLYSSEKLTPKTPQNLQKTQESKLLTNLTRSFSPNSLQNSAGKLKTQISQAKVNTGTPKKKIRATPIVLDAIVNEVVNKHVENDKNVGDEDMEKINDCVYLASVSNEEEEKKAEGLINDSFGDKNDQ